MKTRQLLGQIAVLIATFLLFYISKDTHWSCKYFILTIFVHRHIDDTLSRQIAASSFWQFVQISVVNDIIPVYIHYNDYI